MKRYLLLLWLALLASTCSARSQCDVLRETDMKLLPRSTFDVNYAGPLNGCFSGYLPAGSTPATIERDIYTFGVFRDGEEVVSLPVVTAGMDLASDPRQHLKILAVSFDDLDRDGRRDVMIIGANLAAKGELIFVQIYWGCGNDFDYDEKTNSEVDHAITNKPVVNVKTVARIIAAKKLKSGCEKPRR